MSKEKKWFISSCQITMQWVAYESLINSVSTTPFNSINNICMPYIMCSEKKRKKNDLSCVWREILQNSSVFAKAGCDSIVRKVYDSRKKKPVCISILLNSQTRLIKVVYTWSHQLNLYQVRTYVVFTWYIYILKKLIYALPWYQGKKSDVVIWRTFPNCSARIGVTRPLILLLIIRGAGFFRVPKYTYVPPATVESPTVPYIYRTTVLRLPLYDSRLRTKETKRRPH